MQHTQATLYIGDLLGSKIVTAEGKRIGHVADIQLSPGPEYKVTALLYGRSGWIHRLHFLNPFAKVQSQQTPPDTIPWNAVERFEHSTVTLKPGYTVQGYKHKTSHDD